MRRLVRDNDEHFTRCAIGDERIDCMIEAVYDKIDKIESSHRNDITQLLADTIEIMYTMAENFGVKRDIVDKVRSELYIELGGFKLCKLTTLDDEDTESEVNDG